MAAAVSLIVPVYNVERYLERCLKSLVGQTFKDIEIIVVDDGSTDSSGIIADKFAQTDSRVKVIHKQNGGASSARNAGLKAACAEFCMFVDSDDWLDTDAVGELYTEAVKTGAQVAMFKMASEYENGTVVESTSLFPNGKVMDADGIKRYIYPVMLFSDDMNNVVNKLYSMDFIGLHDISFDETLKYGEDLAFNLEAFTYAQRALYVDKAYYHYFRNEQSVTTTFSEAFYSNIKDIYLRRLGYLKVWGMDTPEYRSQAADGFIKSVISSVKRVIALRRDLGLCSRYYMVRDIVNDRATVKALKITHRPKGFFSSALYYALKLRCSLLITIVLWAFYKLKNFNKYD